MKLIDFLNLFSGDTVMRVVVWHKDNNTEKPDYEGDFNEVPYWLMNTTLDTECGGTLDMFTYTNKHGVQMGKIIINVKD